MGRGEVFLANLDPTIGSEIKKTRPVVVVSNNANNQKSETVTILPLTSNTKKIYPFEVFLPKEVTQLPKDSKAQCHQIRTISKQRLIQGRPAAKLNQDLMSQLEQALRIHLVI